MREGSRFVSWRGEHFCFGGFRTSRTPLTEARFGPCRDTESLLGQCPLSRRRRRRSSSSGASAGSPPCWGKQGEQPANG
jgi:hypothetical protein